jgi:hypothetical protein
VKVQTEPFECDTAGVTLLGPRDQIEGRRLGAVHHVVDVQRLHLPVAHEHPPVGDVASSVQLEPEINWIRDRTELGSTGVGLDVNWS